MQLIHHDCLEAMRAMPQDSIDAVVTDPPYGWRFMGKAWDGADIEEMAAKSIHTHNSVSIDGSKRKPREKPAAAAGTYDTSVTGNQAFQTFSEEWAREVFRVLKPGGYALIFCGPRTYHRMACGVEDAGFEVRDQLQWLFGSGFPKSLDVSKAIDKAAGAERKIVGYGKLNPRDKKSYEPKASNDIFDRNKGMHKLAITAPSTDAAKKWQGWGTSLKPANEPILLARKPLSEKTVAANVLKWGTGGINVDGSRIAQANEADPGKGRGVGSQVNQGRFPANLLLDSQAAQMLDAQSGVLAGRGSISNKIEKTGNENCYGKYAKRVPQSQENLGGGASRFFYVAKSSKREKGVGNTHPTVKPLTLMRYLCRLITPPNGVILDPFMGSGSTGLAARHEGFRFIGIEREAEYMAIAQARLKEETQTGERKCPMKCNP
jgi:DNA modification methylase